MQAALLLTLAFLALLNPICPNNIQITTIKNPILPIQLGNAKLIYTKHTFLHYIDLLPIINQLQNIQKHFNTIKNHLENLNHLNPLSYHGLTENSLTRIEYLINNVENKIRNLYPHLRNKRGLINIMGKAQKWLYGTLDADDGERYDQAINKLTENQKNIIKELNLQISLSKNLVNNYNKTIRTLNFNQQQLAHSINILEAAVDNKISDLSNFISFQGVLSHITLDCQNLINFVDNLEDAILFARLNSLHDSIISSSEIQEMIGYLKTVYNKDEIPIFKNVLNNY